MSQKSFLKREHANMLVSSSSDDFETIFSKQLNQHPPLEKKILRHIKNNNTNNNLSMAKDLRKAIMVLPFDQDSKPF